MDYTKKQRDNFVALNKRLNGYVSLVRTIYDRLNRQASEIVLSSPYTSDSEDPFRFDDYKELGARVEDLQVNFVKELRKVIQTGESVEWRRGNEDSDKLITDVFASYSRNLEDISTDETEVLFNTNNEALKAFKNRKDKGFTLSAKLWNQSKVYKKELEDTISVALEKGMSAVTLSKRVSKYLEDFPSMKRDYTEKYGTASEAKDCQYESIRLARTEINMAYRNAEHERWNNMDFVLGFEIKMSGSHPRFDICDELQGKYPKTFKWSGWHPNCFCYSIPILMTREQFDNWSEGDKVEGMIEDMPYEFKRWVADNADRIELAKDKGTLPYFLNDNANVINAILGNSKNHIHNDFVMTPERLDALSKMDVDISVPGLKRYDKEYISKRYNEGGLGKFDIFAYDRGIVSICDESGIDITRKKVVLGGAYGPSTISYKGTCNGNEFEVSRSFIIQDGIKSVTHSLFKLPNNLQGKGISKKMFKVMIKEYENSGVSIVNVHANIDVGGYCWSKYGFKIHKSNLDDLMLQLEEKSDTFAGMVKEVVAGYFEENPNDTHFPMNLVANIEGSKTFMLSTSWYGIIDMKDNLQVKFIKDYINGIR